jgi:hypothetical protein
VRYRGLKKNTKQLVMLFALSNLWMVRSKLMKLPGVGGMSARKNGQGALTSAKAAQKGNKNRAPPSR